MIKNILFFGAAFVVGSVIALAMRAAQHAPYQGMSNVAQPPSSLQMVTNAPATTVSGHQQHAGHNAGNHRAEGAADADSTGDVAADPRKGTVVNSVCPICGMDVDPSIPPAEYNGYLIGFGCRACPPTFAQNPEHYTNAALENAVVGR